MRRVSCRIAVHGGQIQVLQVGSILCKNKYELTFLKWRPLSHVSNGESRGPVDQRHVKDGSRD